MSKVIVIFEKNWRGYAAGETAGFDSSVADSLVEAGYAVEAGKQAGKKGKSGNGNAAPVTQNTDSVGKPDAQAATDGKP